MGCDALMSRSAFCKPQGASICPCLDHDQRPMASISLVPVRMTPDQGSHRGSGASHSSKSDLFGPLGRISTIIHTQRKSQHKTRTQYRIPTRIWLLNKPRPKQYANVYTLFIHEFRMPLILHSRHIPFRPAKMDPTSARSGR
jgi:hypothetical protein